MKFNTIMLTAPLIASIILQSMPLAVFGAVWFLLYGMILIYEISEPQTDRGDW
jgi:xanthine/uracil permease